MTGPETLDVARDAIWTIVVVSSPLMVVGLVVGVVVSLFQALTQIQEQTLIFVPKILAIFVTLLLALPFMADSLHGHMMRISSRNHRRLDALWVNANRHLATAGARRDLHAGVCPRGRDGDAAARVWREQYPGARQASIALLLTLILLPLHRSAYHVDMGSMASLTVLMLHEIVIGIVLGATARVTLSALQVAGSVIAQQLGLGFVTAVDPTQGQQGLLIGNFLTVLGLTLLFATDTHHLVIAALNESYRIFSPGELLSTGDVAALATRAFAEAFKIGLQLSAPFLVFGLVFNIGLGVLARLMPQMQVYFVGVPLSIMVGFLIFALVITAMMGTYLNYFIGVMHQLTPLK